MEYKKYDMSQQGIYIEYLTNRKDLKSLIMTALNEIAVVTKAIMQGGFFGETG